MIGVFGSGEKEEEAPAGRGTLSTMSDMWGRLELLMGGGGVGGKNTYNVTGARFPQKSRALGSPPHTKHTTSASPSQIARPTPTFRI